MTQTNATGNAYYAGRQRASEQGSDDREGEKVKLTRLRIAFTSSSKAAFSTCKHRMRAVIEEPTIWITRVISVRGFSYKPSAKPSFG